MVWVRKPETVKFQVKRFQGRQWLTEGEKYPLPMFRLGYERLNDERINVDQRIIGFCGKIYPVLRLSIGCVAERPKVYCYGLEEVDAFVVDNFDEKSQKEYFRTKGYGKWWNRNHPGKRRDYSEFFEECARKQDQYEYLFRGHHSPVFVAEVDRWGGSIEFNACLKEYEFYRKFDVYTAFQEIAMYYGGVLGGVREHIPEVSDKDMVEAKGFDKWSFRKEPSKKKS